LNSGPVQTQRLYRIEASLVIWIMDYAVNASFSKPKTLERNGQVGRNGEVGIMEKSEETGTRKDVWTILWNMWNIH